MKKTLLSLFAAFAMAATASAQVTFTCTAGKNFGQNEGIDKMFDGNLNTKYCQNAGDDCYALITASEPIYVWGYDMSTANDNDAYGRCVTRWTLCGTNDENVANDPNAAGWVTLSGFGANGYVQKKNFYTQRFFCDKAKVNTAYKYFKVVLNEGGFIQVSEFAILGETRPVVTYDWKEGSNNDTKKAVDWLLGQKWEGSGGNAITGKYFVIETADGKPHPVESYSMTTHDDGTWTDRAPKSWKLEGSNDMTEWITIDEVIDDETIQNENYKTFEFIPSNTTDAVRYLKLTINAVKGGGYTQLGEFHVKGGYQYTPATCPEHDIVGTNKRATCLEPGYINGTCWKCGYSDNRVLPATGIHTYADGICIDCGWAEALNVVDGFATISNASELDLFSSVSKSSYYKNIKGKLTADVVANAAYAPIGTDACRFTGTLDGQGHSITLNIDTTEGHQGLIGYADGGCTVKNLIVKGQVKTTGDKTAAIIAEAHGGGTVAVENCGNEANVIGAGGETSAIVANNWGGSCTVKITNCYNTGNVSGTGDVSAFCAYGAAVTNSYNTGVITGAKQGMVVRYPRTVDNVYSTACNIHEHDGDVVVITADDVTSGKLCYLLGGAFKQTVGEGKPEFEGEAVYALNISEAGYATYVAESNVDFESLGVKAYKVASLENNYAVLAEVTEAVAGDAVVLKGSAVEKYFNAPASATSVGDNKLVAATAEVAADGTQYVLAQPEGEKVGFYQATTGNIAAGKGYIESTAGIKAFYFEKENATAISSAAAEAENAVIYNIAGQRIQKMQKGINVVNGVKVLK